MLAAHYRMNPFLLIIVTTITIQSTASPSHDCVGVRFKSDWTLFKEMQAVIGIEQCQAIEENIVGIEERLRPMFVAMPKNEHGKLGRVAVRYALHRLFMQHGWSVRGLAPVGEAWNSGTPTIILQDHVPEYIHHLFEKQLGCQGFSIHEVAVLAATFKNYMQNEMFEKLFIAYQVNHLSNSGALDEGNALQVLDTYAASFIVGNDIKTMSRVGVKAFINDMHVDFPLWPEIQKLVYNLQQDLIPTGVSSFSNLKHVVKEIGERMGSWSNADCLTRKHELAEIEEQSSGRVLLSSFYRIALYEGKWHFGENSKYLRHLGALDDSDPDALRVIIPNWVNSASNCLDPSKYYSICCLNECGELLEQFERQVKAPDATPTDVTAIAAALPSESVSANRVLPTALLRRLEEVANVHGGRIPLYGRLFAQWMHHAYPRECPFPHISGRPRPRRVDEWAAATGIEVSAQEEEMLQCIDAAQSQQPRPVSMDEEDRGSVPWLMEEELLEPRLPLERAPD